LFGVAAWVMGNSDLEEMNRGYMDPTGRDLTTTGRILGMVATGLLITSLIVLGFFVLIPMVMSALH
jgi:FtsH-binding integral membrane protein